MNRGEVRRGLLVNDGGDRGCNRRVRSREGSKVTAD